MSCNYKFHNPEEYIYSSTKDYAGEKGVLENVILVEI
jgi:hypothetical protein